MQADKQEEAHKSYDNHAFVACIVAGMLNSSDYAESVEEPGVVEVVLNCN